MKGRAAPDRRILFVGILNKYLGGEEPAVLVGGALVEFYTGGQYVTGDVDLIGRREKIRQLLVAAGFQEQGRYLFRDDLGLVTEVPSAYRRPTETVVEAEVEGLRIPMVSVEDAIIDRLLAAKYWRSPTDWEQAILMWTSHESELKRAELKRKASENLVDDKLAELEALLEQKNKPGSSKKA